MKTVSVLEELKQEFRQEGKQEGWIEGIQAGKQEGKQEGIAIGMQAAKEALVEGLLLEFTGFSDERIAALGKTSVEVVQKIRLKLARSNQKKRGTTVPITTVTNPFSATPPPSSPTSPP